MKRLYLDTEFNGHRGELISLALADPDGDYWYGIWPRPVYIEPWVLENVIPKLDVPDHRPRVIGSEDNCNSLRKFLTEREGVVIYADWPDDFVHLLRCMSGPSYNTSWVVPLRMHLLKDTDPKPKIPHNALSDAIALMEWHLEKAWT